MKMNNNNKKNIAQILIFVAVAFLIAANFFPIMIFDYDDYWESQQKEVEDKENSPFIWRHEYYYTFLHSYLRLCYLEDMGDEKLGLESIFIFNIVEIPLQENIDIGSETRYYGADETYSPSTNVVTYSLIPLIILSFFAAFYYCFQSLKNISKRYTRFPLYAGITFSILTVIYLLTIRTAINVLARGRNFFNYVEYSYGLYYSIIAILLFFIAFLMQKYIVYEKEGKNDILVI